MRTQWYSNSMRSLVISISIFMAVFALATPLQLTESSYTPPNKYEQLVNQVRESKGLQGLSSNKELRSSACTKAQDMIDRDYWSHDEPGSVRPWHLFVEAGYDYTHAGENLAKGYTTPDSTVDAWVASPKHYENIVGDYKDQGICTKTGEFMGRVQAVTVQHLGTR